MLESIGLSPAEQAAYEALVTGGPLALDAATAARLEELGLVTRLPEDPLRYAAVSPELALDGLITERTAEVSAARHRIAQLTARFERSAPGRDDPVEVVIGREAVAARFEQVQEATRRRIRVFDAPPYSMEVGANDVQFALLERGVDYRTLYDRRAVEQPGTLSVIARYLRAGERARVGVVPVKLVISDYPMAIVLPLRHVESALVVRDSTLLDALSALFELCWERAVPLRVGRERLAEAAGPSEVQRDLLPLLTAGLTDAAIAAHLGWSDRTVRRHVRALMLELDARTRFQAGYQAVERGWLAGS